MRTRMVRLMATSVQSVELASLLTIAMSPSLQFGLTDEDFYRNDYPDEEEDSELELDSDLSDSRGE